MRGRIGRDAGPTEQIAVRLTPPVLKALDELRAKLSQPGLEITRADAVRVALEKGLEVLRRIDQENKAKP